ncbi:MAG: beta-mannosidase [Bacteroidaceae bacterium]|nr:beta-mannosidase [Bacteroidaceae bacterium]
MEKKKTGTPYLAALLLVLLPAFLLSSCKEPKTPSLSQHPCSPEAETLLAGLHRIAESPSFMFGHQDDTAYGHSWKYEDGRSDTKDVCGDYPGVIGFDLGHLELGHSRNLDGVPFDWMRREIIWQYERGGMVTLSWHLDNPLTGGNAWDFSNKETVSSILPGGSLHDEFLVRLGRVADFLGSVVTESGVKVPMLFRPWHEHTGSWFWWGQDNCTTEQYKALWRMTFDFMQKRGLTNLLWAYSPGSEPKNQEEFFERYPGDDIMDVLGFDTYQSNSREGYLRVMKKSLDVLIEAAQTHNKVAAVTETGYESTPDSTWWTGTLIPALDNAPIAYVLVWRNAWDRETHHYGIYPGHESEADFMTFYNDSRTVFANDAKLK